MENLKITGIDIYTLSDASNPISDSTMRIGKFGSVILDVQTNSDIRGVGVGVLEMSDDAVRSSLEWLGKHVIGMNPLANEDVYQRMLQVTRGFGRKGYAFQLISAIDIALWDIKGKAAKLPLFRLLGGTKNRIPIYYSGGWTSYSTDRLVNEAIFAVAEGYKHVKIKVGVEGGKNTREDVRRVAAVRKAIGDDVELILDANNAWTAGVAAKFAQDIAEYNILFFEEPCMADDIPGLAHVRSKASMPIATGEHEYTRYGTRDLMLGNALDIFQGDVCRIGGFTELLKANAIAQAWNLQFAPHCADFIHSHLVSAAPNGFILERLANKDNLIEKLYLHPPIPRDGFLDIPELPGLGLEPDYEYIKACQDTGFIK